MILIRTTSKNPDFQKLTALFDEFLVDIDGDEKDFFANFNQIYLDNVILCYDNDSLAGCGALKKHDNQITEIKRMFVHPDHRNKGVAKLILNELEIWSKELGATSCILETSFKLTSAIALYEKASYSIIENYGQYIGVESSVCMKKFLN